MLQQFHPANFENRRLRDDSQKIISFEAAPALFKTLRARGDVLVGTLIAETYLSVNDRIKTSTKVGHTGDNWWFIPQLFPARDST